VRRRDRREYMEHSALYNKEPIDANKVIDGNQQLQLFALRPPKQLLKVDW